MHPIVPFITEEVWQRLAAVAPKRGLKAIDATESVMVASWPEADDALRDEEIETRFSYFQKVLAGVREIRSRQQIAPRKQVSFSVRCDAQASEALAAMKPYFDSMAAAVVMDLGPQVEAPLFSATANTEGMQVFVDMEDLIDVAAEITRNENELTRLQKAIAGKEKKLGNQSFVSKAPVEVVAREKESLQKLQLEVDFHTSTLAKLKAL